MRPKKRPSLITQPIMEDQEEEEEHSSSPPTSPKQMRENHPQESTVMSDQPQEHGGHSARQQENTDHIQSHIDNQPAPNDQPREDLTLIGSVERQGEQPSQLQEQLREGSLGVGGTDPQPADLEQQHQPTPPPVLQQQRDSQQQQQQQRKTSTPSERHKTLTEDTRKKSAPHEKFPQEVIGQDSGKVPEENTSPWPPCVQWMVAISQLLGGLNIGMNLGVIGPVLPDLSLLTGQPVDMVSTIFTWRAVTYIACSLVAGPLFDRLDAFFLIAVGLVLQGVATAAMVFFSNLLILCLVNATANFFSTLVNIGTIFLAFQMKGKNARSLVQGVLLIFNVGKAIIPLMAAPFLAPGANATTPVSDISTEPEGRPETNVQWVFVLLAFISLLTSVLYFVLFCITGCTWHHTTTQESQDVAQEQTAESASPEPLMVKIRILGVFGFLVVMLTGMETADGGILMTFVTDFLGWEKSMGVALTSLYQGIKVVSCAVVALAIRFLNPPVILLVACLMLTASSAVMTAAIAAELGQALLWTCVVVLALGMSSAYGTLLTYLDMRYTMTGKLSSLASICFGIGSSAIPPLATHLLVQNGPVAFPATMLVGSIISLGLFFCFWLLMNDLICFPRDVVPPRDMQNKDPEKVPILATAPKPAYSLHDTATPTGSPALHRMTPGRISINKGLYLLSRDENLSGSFKKDDFLRERTHTR